MKSDLIKLIKMQVVVNVNVVANLYIVNRVET